MPSGARLPLAACDGRGKRICARHRPGRQGDRDARRASSREPRRLARRTDLNGHPRGSQAERLRPRPPADGPLHRRPRPVVRQPGDQARRSAMARRPGAGPAARRGLRPLPLSSAPRRPGGSSPRHAGRHRAANLADWPLRLPESHDEAAKRYRGLCGRQDVAIEADNPGLLVRPEVDRREIEPAPVHIVQLPRKWTG